MTIAPVVLTVQVKAAPARAFDLFTLHIDHWWPRERTVGKSPLSAVTIEPRQGGRWFETGDDGAETDWGEVLAWEPPSRLLLAWRINTKFSKATDVPTEVELTFTEAEDGGTQVTLTHGKLERFGADAELVAGKLSGGWPLCLENFASFAAANA